VHARRVADRPEREAEDYQKIPAAPPHAATQRSALRLHPAARETVRAADRARAAGDPTR
jgi:hypothetical protein